MATSSCTFWRTRASITDYIVRKPGRRTSAVVLGIEPPDKFPLVYYRDNCADIAITIDDVLAAPVQAARVVQFAGTNFSKEPSRSATTFAAELARQAGSKVVLDIDFRPDQWHDPRAFGVAIRSVLRTIDVVIGTAGRDQRGDADRSRQMSLTHSQVSDTKVSGDIEAAIANLLALGPEAVIEKAGDRGARFTSKTAP